MQTIRDLLRETAQYEDRVEGSRITGFRSTAGNTSTYYPDILTFPFRTEAARKVFNLARDLMVDNPETPVVALVRHALPATGYGPEDLAPEDWTLLQMAADALQSHSPDARQVFPGESSGSAIDSERIKNGNRVDDPIRTAGLPTESNRWRRLSVRIGRILASTRTSKKPRRQVRPVT